MDLLHGIWVNGPAYSQSTSWIPCIYANMDDGSSPRRFAVAHAVYFVENAVFKQHHPRFPHELVLVLATVSAKCIAMSEDDSTKFL
jgi:hypothetical protein